MKIKTLFATDFGKLSQGGILNFLRSLGALHPSSIEMTYVGLGPLAGPLPSETSHYLALGGAVRPGERAGVNKKYLKRLLMGRSKIFKDTDLVILHRPEYSIAIPSQIPSVAIFHGGSWGLWRSQKTFLGLIYPLIELFAGLRAVKVFSVTPSTHTWLFRKLCKPAFLPPSFDDNIFKPINGSYHCRPAEPLRLVAAARLVCEKQLDLLIKLASLLPGSSVDIFGDGPELAKLKYLAAKLKVPVTFHGMARRQEIRDWYQKQSPIFIVCSKFEGFPIAALEAAASGVPVVGMAAPGVTTALPLIGGYIANNFEDLPGKVIKAAQMGPQLESKNIYNAFRQGRDNAAFWSSLGETIAKPTHLGDG